MGNVALVEGSSRSNGDTRRLTDHLLQNQTQWVRFDLNQFNIEHYDYSYQNRHDDFLQLAQQLLTFPKILLVSPVYWYAVSGRMKVFMDRISDLLDHPNKDLGRQFRGKVMGSLSCSRDPNLVPGFEMPLRETAQYLGMDYVGHFHAWVVENSIPAAAAEQLNRLVENLS
ncbi:MAG: NAD(P)H-dependent oxidoreductase [Cyclobacteriaceae bacterium]|nr:NAD(P)H-dependent oxidoreductase [Cyclobacteriaceae bacterium]